MKQKRWMTSVLTTAKAPLPALPWQRSARRLAAATVTAAVDSLTTTPHKATRPRSIRSA